VLLNAQIFTNFANLMKTLVERFSRQLAEANTIADKAVLEKSAAVQHIVVTGLGGSGIGGTVIAELVADSCSVPVLVNKDYFLPAYVGKNSLVIVSSYSGNTEETLQAMESALQKGAQVVCITSGGKIREIAKQHQLGCIEIPGGMPPRSCFGYSMVQLIKVLVVNGFAPSTLFDDLKKAIALLDAEEQAIQKEAMALAKKLQGKFAMLYSLGSCEGVVVRFRQQINENGKMLCCHHTFPEMNHNELVGWVDENKDLAVVAFRTSFDYARTVKRYEFCKPLFEKLSSSVTDVVAKGSSKLEQFIYLVHLGDWASCYLADLKGIDAVEVKIIDQLKAELSKY
jgi:glucose/mannose-6-phosphate isomerase